MSRRHSHEMPLPEHYRAPTYVAWDQKDTMPGIAWDMDMHWLTASEWLSWVRRRDGRKTRWDGKTWSYPPRPQIAAGFMPYSTTMARRLP